MGSRLVLVCGLPGSGKTTLAERVAGEIGAARLSPDDWMRALGIDLFDQPARGRVEALQWELAQELLALGTSVVIEWGFWTRADVLWERVHARGREEAWGSRSITREELEEWAASFEALDAAELAGYDPPAR